MAPKRPNEDGDAADKLTKKLRQGFRVGPDNLPDGAWKRKGMSPQWSCLAPPLY